MKRRVEGVMPEDAVAAADEAFPNVATIGIKLTDLGNAERLVALHRDRIRYCTPRRRWLTWDGQRWAWDETGDVIRLAKRTVRRIYSEAEHARSEDEAKAIAKHAVKSEQLERINAMVKLATSEPGIAVTPAELDANPWILCARNGTVDLKKGALREARRTDLITKMAGAEFHAAAHSDLWQKFLTDATGGDAELEAYLRRAVGYALFGAVTEKAFWFLYGPPDGMKSTFIHAIKNAFGEYAVSADFTTWLVQTSTGGNRGDVVSLLGARLVTSVEVRKGAAFDEAIIKKVTGGDALKAAAKYEAEIEFLPTFALWLAANDAPLIRDDDEGAWSRVRRLPFTNPLPKAKQDPEMREKLSQPEVRAAVLAWAVRGCLEWHESGLGVCAAMDRSTAEYRKDVDRISGFFASECVFDPRATVTKKDLREAYEVWCRENAIKSPMSQKEVSRRLEERGVLGGNTGKVRFWAGIRLRRDDDPDAGGETDGLTPADGFSEKYSHETHLEKVPGDASVAVSCQKPPAWQVEV